MKLFIVTCNLTAGTCDELQEVFKSKPRAREFVENKFLNKKCGDFWDDDSLQCHDKDKMWIGYVKITSIDTAKLKY